ncbi:MAG: hypothetical protein Q8M47_14680 [Devosia sp.]|jgi:hypothetical protein|nr:hypothetical protein [Devosia sp.]
MLPKDWAAVRFAGGLLGLTASLWLAWAILGRDPYFAYVLILGSIIAISGALGGLKEWISSLLSARNELLEQQGQAKLDELQAQFDNLIAEDEERSSAHAVLQPSNEGKK